MEGGASISRIQLFLGKDPYRTKKDPCDFVQTTKDMVAHHQKCCPEYAAILKAFGYQPEKIETEADLWRIPPLPTLYFKRNRLFSTPENTLSMTVTSSGTQGSQSIVGLDKKTLALGVGMAVRFFAYHHAVSLLPVRYIILGPPPGAAGGPGAPKTAYGVSKLAPALGRTYALLPNDAGGFALNTEGVRKMLLRAGKHGAAVRFIGFPAYMYFLAKTLEEEGLSLRLGRRSKVLLGGGWKQFSAQQIDKEAFYPLIERTLGIPRQNCLEFFSAVEHPQAYCRCEAGHFHVPVYSRVFIRDIRTNAPLPAGQAGILSFVSPLVTSMPLVSVMTDDIAVAGEANSCGCGNPAPWFDLLGRAGVAQIKTCSADAAELLSGVGK